MPITDNIGIARETRRFLRLGQAQARATTVAVALLMSLAAPVAANAACEVPDTPNGIPEDAAFKVDVGGTRAALARAGIGVGGAYYGEAFYNWGGFDQGGEYDGVLELYVNADMKKLGFWKGLCFQANGYQIHGNSITGANIGSLMPVSNLEATDATRLFEIWFEQTMFNERVAVRFGQLAADAEFVISEGGGNFLNGTWGWPSITAADLPSGGPAYPLATPGVRVAVNPNDKFGVMVAVYNGDPAPPCWSDDPQICNNHGLDFELDDPPLLMAEGVYKYNQAGLAGAVKFGGWNHFGKFEHQRFDSGGALIAVTGNSGRPLDSQLGPVRHHRPAYLACARQRGGERRRLVRPGDRRAGGPQPDRLVFRRRYHLHRHVQEPAGRRAGDRLRLYQYLRPGVGLRYRFRRAGGAQLRGADRDLLYLRGQAGLVDPA